MTQHLSNGGGSHRSSVGGRQSECQSPQRRRHTHQPHIADRQKDRSPCLPYHTVTMEVRSNLWLLLLLAMMLLSSFVVMGTDDVSDSKQPSEKESNENGGDKTGNREKRSREEIMFGNQQNKPSGLVDDIMAPSEKSESGDTQTSEDSAKNATDKQDSDQEKLEDALKDDEKDDKKKDDLDQYSADADMIEGNSYDNWYANPQASADAPLQYFLTPQLQDLPSDVADDEIYDGQEYPEVYRRKRQLLGHPLALRKRSLRSPLGQMVSRGRRLPRRSMRLKRQVDVEDLLSLLGNIENNNPRYFEDQTQSNANQQLQDIPPAEFRYPYNFVRPDDEDEDGEEEQNMLAGSPFLDSEYTVPYRGRPEPEPEWMVRHPPQVFSVSRRSVPGFYPVDYRFMPAAYRKRTPRTRWLPGNGNGNTMADDEETDFGKWGRIVQVPEAYASAEDVARLYALANLMAESEEGQTGRMRPSL